MPSRSRVQAESVARHSVVVLCTVGSSACSGETPPASQDSGPTKVVCEAPGYASQTPPRPFESLTATVIDLDGTPAPMLRAQACGIDLCLNETTREDGTVSIQKDTDFVKPAFKYGVGRRYAKFAFPLENGPHHMIGEHRTVRFPDPATSVPLEPGTEVASGGVTLSLRAEMNEPELEPFDFDTPELRGFRAAEVPIDQAPPAVDPELGLELVFAMTPVGATLCPAATMTVDNTLGWDAGSAVEFFLHGVEVDEAWAPYAGWTRIAEGRVSSDGSTISTEEGGIPILSVVGIRRAQ